VRVVSAPPDVCSDRYAVMREDHVTDLIQLPVSAQSDPKGEAIRAILNAHLAFEHTRATRQFWVHLSAILGALSILLPQATPPQARALVLALWGVCSVCALVAAGFECIWRWRAAHLLAAHQIS